MLKTEVRKLAEAHGWGGEVFQENISMLSYFKEGMRINIYLTKMTVGTVLNHPKQGKTQMFRKHVTPKELDKLFENPRQHTGKGYRKKVRGTDDTRPVQITADDVEES